MLPLQVGQHPFCCFVHVIPKTSPQPAHASPPAPSPAAPPQDQPPGCVVEQAIRTLHSQLTHQAESLAAGAARDAAATPRGRTAPASDSATIPGTAADQTEDVAAAAGALAALLQRAAVAEWWAHVRVAGGDAHQLHFDVNEDVLRGVSEGGKGRRAESRVASCIDAEVLHVLR